MDNISTKPFNFELRIYFEDTDTAGVVYYANYLKYFERARSELFRHYGYTQTELADSRSIGFMVKHAVEDFILPAKLDDLIVIKTSLLKTRKASFILKQDAYRGDDILVESTIQMVVVDSTTHSPTRIPKDIYEKMISLETE